MTKSKGSHAAPRSARALDCVVVSRRGSATSPSSALPAHALSGARMHEPLNFLIYAGAVDSEAVALLDALPDGVVVADADGTVTVVNQTARRLLGPAAVPGHHLREVVALQDKESCDWYSSNKPYDGLGNRVGLTEQA